MNSKLLIIIGIVAGVATMAFVIGYVGQGTVRHVPIFSQEKVEQTVIFEDIDGEVQLRAISGVAGDPNPTLISRTSFVYILTVINDGDKHHRLYIEGLNVQTDLLAPGEKDTITIMPTEEGIYNYYDKRQHLKLLGEIQIVSVIPSDEFEGFLKDMI